MFFVFLLASMLFLGCGSSESKMDEVFDLVAEQDVIEGDFFDIYDALETPDVQDADLEEAEEEEVSNPPLLYAKKAMESSDLVGGDNAYGRVGESYVLGNSKARFLIQDKGVAIHLSLFGGNLIDMDAVREDGSKNDQFREMFPVVGFRTMKTESVEVLKDGSDGKEAIVRASGMDDNTGIIPTLDSLAVPLNIKIITDYILEPDKPYLKVRTTVENKNDFPLENMVAGDFISFGGAQHLLTRESGFGPEGGEYEFIVSYGRGASYGYAMSAGKVNVPLIEASGAIAINTFSLTAQADGSAYFDRYFVVGNGDVASAIDIIREIRGESFHTVSGIILSEKQGKPLSGAKK
ncbi:MAG: hypothetical protein FJ088_12310, partial [Deltaproteobacteria bacterium]|nr:hypothetical protein [Deltaproteobacteria bacterium]